MAEQKFITSKGHSYEVVRKLGEGYTGEVYLVKDKQRNEPVALKLLNAEAFKEGQLEAFKREFSILSDLHHPHLCKVYDFGITLDEGRYFFTSELIQGTDLYKYTDKLSVDEIEEIFVQIADALGFIHSAGLIHFDIKGANILITMVNNKPLAKVVDFGLAAPSVDVPGNIVGTVRYISPEMISKNQTIDYHADLYSLGIVLYRMLAKQYPEQGNTMEDVLSWHLKHTSVGKEPLEKAGAPDYLIDVIEKLTNPIPTERFSSASVIIKYIELHSGRSYKKTQRELLTTLTEEGPLVGRDNLMRKIRTNINTLSKKEPLGDSNSTLILAGPQGIGKSRILKETKYISQLSEVQTFIIHGKEEGQDIQYIRKIFGLSEGTETFDIVAEASKLEPLCLMVDDLDKCNQQIRDMFTGLANFLYSSKFMGKPLNIYLIITMTVSDAGGGLPIALHLGVDEAHLSPLTEEEITQYIRQFLGESNPPTQQIKDIYNFSGGIPELVKTAIASLESATSRLTRDTEALFTARINGLSPLAKDLLGLLAIVEKPLRQEQLITLTGATVETGLTELNKAAFTTFDRKEESYSVATGAIASAVKASFTKDELTKFAKKLLDYTVKNDPNDIELLVKFAELGASKEELCGYVTKAAETKESRGEVDQAYNYYQQALTLLPDTDGKRPEIYRKLARFSILTGKLSIAGEFINKALKLTATTAEDLMSLSWVDRLKHDPKAALEHIQNALNLTDIKTDEANYLRLLNEKAACYMQMDETNEAENIFRDTYVRAGKLPDEEKRKIANNNLGLALARAGKYSEAIKFYEEKNEYFSKDKRIAASILSHLGYVYQQASRLDEAYYTYKNSFELASSIGDTHNAATILGNIICLCQSKALFTDALFYAQESIKLSSQASSEKALGSNFLTIGALYVNLGLEDIAKKYLTEAVSIFQKLGNNVLEAWAQLSFAYLYKNLGRYKEALAYFDVVNKKAKELNAPALLNMSLSGGAEVCIDGANYDKAREYIDDISVNWPGTDLANESDIKIELLRCKLSIHTQKKPDNSLVKHLLEMGEVTTKQGLRELASEIYHVIGVFYEKNGDEKKSAKYIAKAKEIIDDIAGSLSEEYRDSFLRQKFRKTVSDDSVRLSRSMKMERDKVLGIEISGSGKAGGGEPTDRTTGIQPITAPTMAFEGKAVAQKGAGEIVGQSEAIAKINDIIDHVKESHTTVLICGPAGSGKELIAKNIHATGAYKNTKWQMINFSDLPEEFLKDELFGLEKEALLEAAGNGILFLKHIHDMPTSIQKDLLKAIKNKKFARLRDKKDVPLSCRFISSSNLSMDELLKKAKFNKDLLKLIASVPIVVPPLRDRTEDIPLLIDHYLAIIAKEKDTVTPYSLNTAALKALLTHDWKGNVRELDQVLKGACVLSTEGQIGLPEIEVHLGKNRSF